MTPSLSMPIVTVIDGNFLNCSVRNGSHPSGTAVQIVRRSHVSRQGWLPGLRIGFLSSITSGRISGMVSNGMRRAPVTNNIFNKKGSSLWHVLDVAD